MGNPTIAQQAPFTPSNWPPEPNTYNGILNWIRADDYPRSSSLPPAGPDLKDDPLRFVEAEVPSLGLVRFTFELYWVQAWKIKALGLESGLGGEGR
jgi:hypothetical protein